MVDISCLLSPWKRPEALFGTAVLAGLCSDCSNPWKGPVTPLVCWAITSPDRKVGESLGALSKHTHFLLAQWPFLPTLKFV